jgi:pilus assembly protein FimV
VISSPPFVRVEPPPSDPVAAREVSVEELLDLEQQADFFIALGQEEAAIDLLMAHLRSTGGLSPLPYTKLLEIYRRQGDRDAYERIRTRFNRRFNAYAPEWEDGPLSGRALEDYPEVVQHLQSLWPEPLDAMAMLEAMLFRKDAAYELFDLPAYKDVLVLYALARDLWQQGGSKTPAVDVLLPLDGDAGPDAAHATVESAASPADAPPFELTSFALPPLQGQVVSAPPLPDDAGDADTEPTLDPARRTLR